MTSLSPSFAVSYHFIKPQATFLSLPAPRYQHPWSLRAKENSTETRPPSGGGFLFGQNLRLNTDWSIHLGIQHRSILRKIPNTQSEIKHLCALLLLKGLGRKKRLLFCGKWFPHSSGRQRSHQPTWSRRIWKMLVFNPNFSKNLKRDIKGEIYFSLRREPSVQW